MDEAPKPPEELAYLQRIELAIQNVANEVTHIRTRVEHVETKQGEYEERAVRASGGVRELRAETSHHDLAQEAKLADALVRQQQLEKDAAEAKAEATAAKEAVAVVLAETKAQTEILSRLDKITKNPIVKAGVTIALTAMASYLATKGVHVQ